MHTSDLPAPPGGESAQTVSNFWYSFEGLLLGFNERRIESGKPALTWRELADKFDINDRTLSDWKTKRIVPASSAPLVKAAVFLGGREEDWRARWRAANNAHETLVTSRRSLTDDPDCTADHVQVMASAPSLEGTGGPAVPGSIDSHPPMNDTHTGTGKPIRPSFSGRFRLVALTVTIAAAVLTMVLAVLAVTAKPSPEMPGFADGQCQDVARARAPVHSAPVEGDETGYIAVNGQTVTGPCRYFIDESGDSGNGRWFMQVTDSGPNSSYGYGYIWVQQLAYGSSHSCDRDGYNGSSGYHSYAINSDVCLLIIYPPALGLQLREPRPGNRSGSDAS
jgi:hypothetical protein